ncbi:MAG TPA: hypothetical protein VGD26_05760 [Chitinophagaceae bacterium]
MKLSFLIAVIFFTSCATAKEKHFTGSTPANAIVKSFLGIPLTDSIDFIRWKLQIDEDHYNLHCNYGIGKPNTDGFINGGRHVNLEGSFIKQGHYYRLHQPGKELGLMELNPDLLFMLDENKNLLVGNAGWSYVLNNETPEYNGRLNISSKSFNPKDSMVYQGRTPCHNFPGVDVNHCNKLKWSLVLFTDPQTGQPSYYKMEFTAFRREGVKTGKWSVVNTNGGVQLFKLEFAEAGVIFLLPLDNSILVFTKENAVPLVGNRNFSFILNRY